MKKLTALVVTLVCICCFAACSANDNGEPAAQTEMNTNPAAESRDAADAPEESGAEYGCLQELVDTYGFPIQLRMTEGMELTKIVIDEASAERMWTSSLDGSSFHGNLAWSIAGNHLVISGDWEEEFTVNVETGRAVSALDGQEYKIVIYNEAGDPVFQVE